MHHAEKVKQQVLLLYKPIVDHLEEKIHNVTTMKLMDQLKSSYLKGK